MKTALLLGGARSVRKLLAAGLVVVSVSACAGAGDSGGGGAASSCASLVEYRNHMYSGAEARGFTVGDELGTATVPPCDDTPGDDSDSDGRTAPASATAYAIEGVDPGIAIVLEREAGDLIFVNAGSGKELPEIKKMIKAS